MANALGGIAGFVVAGIARARGYRIALRAGQLFSIEKSTLAVEEVMIQAHEWAAEDGSRYCGITLANDSALGNGLETLSVPVVATEKSHFLLDGRAVDMATAAESFATEGPRRAHARLKRHDGWPEVSELTLGNRDAPAPESSGATFHWNAYGDLLANAKDGTCEAGEGGAVHVKGCVRSTDGRRLGSLGAGALGA